MPVKSVEVGRNAIRLTFLIKDQSGMVVMPECYTVRRRKPIIGMGLASLAHRDPQALSEAIKQLKTAGEEAENRGGRFTFFVMRKLESAFVAIGNSEEA